MVDDEESDLVAGFRAMDELSKARRASNRDGSPKILEREGISFSSRNYGAHLIVYGKVRTADFWPGTGRWIIRGGKKGFGVFNLVKLLKGDK